MATFSNLIQVVGSSFQKEFVERAQNMFMVSIYRITIQQSKIVRSGS